MPSKVYELKLQLATTEADLENKRIELEKLNHRKEFLIEEIISLTNILGNNQIQENVNAELVSERLKDLKLQLSDTLLSIKLLEIKYEWLEAKRDALFAELWSYTDMDKLVEKEVPIFGDEN